MSDGRAGPQNVFAGRRGVLAAHNDRDIRIFFMDRIDHVLDVRPILRKHDGNADAIRTLADTIENRLRGKASVADAGAIGDGYMIDVFTQRIDVLHLMAVMNQIGAQIGQRERHRDRGAITGGGKNFRRANKEDATHIILSLANAVPIFKEIEARRRALRPSYQVSHTWLESLPPTICNSPRSSPCTFSTRP